MQGRAQGPGRSARTRSRTQAAARAPAPLSPRRAQASRGARPSARTRGAPGPRRGRAAAFATCTPVPGEREGDAPSVGAGHPVPRATARRPSGARVRDPVPAGTRSAVRGAELRAELPPAPQGQYRARGFLPTQGDWTTRLRGSCVRRRPCWSPSEREAEGRAPAGPQVSGLAGLSALRMGVYFRRMLGQIPENLPSACCLHEAQTIYLYKCFY